MGTTNRRQPVTFKLPDDEDFEFLNIADFKGIEINENPFQTDTASASKSLNVYVDESGALTTRPRLEYKTTLSASSNLNPLKVFNLKNGYLELIHAVSSNTNFIRIFKNNTYYEVKQEGHISQTATVTSISAVIESGDLIYILTSDNYKVIYFDSTSSPQTFFMKDVEAYIPTTTVGKNKITYNLDDETSTIDIYGTKYESLNILTPRYKESYFWDGKVDTLPTGYSLIDDQYHKVKNLEDLLENTFGQFTVIMNYWSKEKENNQENCFVVVDATTNKYYMAKLSSDYSSFLYTEITDLTISGAISLDILYAKDNPYLICCYETQTDKKLKYIHLNFSTMSYEVHTNTNISLDTSFVLKEISDNGMFAGGIYGEYIETYEIGIPLIFSYGTSNIQQATINLDYSTSINKVRTFFFAKDLSLTNPYSSFAVISSPGTTRGWFTPVVLTGTIDAPIFSRNGDHTYEADFVYDVLKSGSLISMGALDNTYGYYLTYSSGVSAARPGFFFEKFQLSKPSDGFSTYALSTSLYTQKAHITSNLSYTNDIISLYINSATDTVVIPDISNANNYLTYITYKNSTDAFTDYFEEGGNILREDSSGYSLIIFEDSTEPLLYIIKELNDVDEEYTNWLQRKTQFLQSMLTTRFDNNQWFSSGNRIYFTSYNDLTYIPITNYNDLGDTNEEITGFNIASDSLLIAYKKNKLYFIQPTTVNDTYTYLYTETKNTFGNTAIGAPIVTTLRERPVQVNVDGIYYLYQMKNVQTTDLTCQILNKNINQQWLKESSSVINNCITLNRLYWTYFILPDTVDTVNEYNQAITKDMTKVYLLDNRTESWFYWEFPVKAINAFVKDNVVELVDVNANVYTLQTTEIIDDKGIIQNDEYYDEYDDKKEIIDWYWESQILPFKTINYLKLLKNTTFIVSDGDGADSTAFNYDFDVFRKTATNISQVTISKNLNFIRSITVKSHVPRFNFLKLRLSCVKEQNEDPRYTFKNNKIRLISIGFKFVLSELSRG